MHLIESALIVFSAKGVDAAVVDDVIAQADVSRGTFYIYFSTNDEFMAAVMREVGNELLMLVEAAVQDRREAAMRLACALRMVLHTTRRFPLVGRFGCRAGMEAAAHTSLALTYLPRDLVQGIEAGRFQLNDGFLGMDLIAGSVRAAIYAMVSRAKIPATYPEEVTYHLMLALGLSKAVARKLVSEPLPPIVIPPDSLLGCTRRLTHRWRAAPI